jgi:hypothetical protein
VSLLTTFRCVKELATTNFHVVKVASLFMQQRVATPNCRYVVQSPGFAPDIEGAST